METPCLKDCREAPKERPGEFRMIDLVTELSTDEKLSAANFFAGSPQVPCRRQPRQGHCGESLSAC